MSVNVTGIWKCRLEHQSTLNLRALLFATPGGQSLSIVSASVTDKAVLKPAGALRVIVADDDPIVRNLVASRVGIMADLVEAADGLEAWDCIRKQDFHLAFVDLEMPNMDGFALIQCIRSYPRTRHMPVVVLTCHGDQDSLRRALEAGASSYMVKPLTWSMFNAHVKHLLELGASAA